MSFPQWLSVSHLREALSLHGVRMDPANAISSCTSEYRSERENASHWYAVYTYPRHEQAVTERLESKSVEVYFPTVVIESHWTDRRVRVQSPVFPGYIFTRIHLNERIKVITVPGVIRMVSSNGTPIPIDDSEIDNVRLCQKRGAIMGSHPFLGVGDRVRVRSGVLEGLEGFIARCKGERRLVVPIALINQSVVVEVDFRSLEPISSQPRGRCCHLD